jgi:hypothetical protein
MTFHALNSTSYLKLFRNMDAFCDYANFIFAATAGRSLAFL